MNSYTDNMKPLSKKCSKCGAIKSLDEFENDRRRTTGKQSHCKTCRREYNRQRRINHPEKMSAIARRSYYRHHEKQLADARAYRKENRERIRQRDRMIYVRKRGEILARNKQYYAEHPDIYKAHCAVSTAKASGQLVAPERCTQCGVAGPVQAHHHDYSKPLEVEWLCVPCHRKRHVGIDISGQKAA